ncbi:protein SAR DEFICIENT 1-like isoform X2 [Curcuma longa]|uniref:protein SAR DEFICIENT 1-like isoform X2 n=1 Tax=Curcuma longa TaxID=136217 RepID=UPI003D9E4F01
MEFGRARSELASHSNQQRATGMRTRPTFKEVIMQALGIKYVGLVMNPLVRNLLHDELARIVPQIEFAVRQEVQGELQNIIPLVVDQIALVMRQQLREELMNAITQINTQTNGIVVQQVEPLIAHEDHLQRLHIREVGPAAPNLQLSFQKKLLQSTFYAEELIKDEDCNNLQVALRQIESGQIYSLPLEFPVEVEIVVIDGEFPGDSSGEWSTEEFNSKILKGREGRKPLLVGACKARLHEGIASFGDIKLTDSSKPGKFRLGAKVSPSSHVRRVIKPAVTECFKVLVERSKQHRKNYPPSLDDKVYKLENIRLNGEYMKRLATHKITTVKDFLKLSVVDQERLQKITNMKWPKLNETVRHANTCDKGEVLYMYSRESFHLILNSICEVQSVTIDGVPRQLEHLTLWQKEFVKKLVSEAYDKGDNLERFYGNSPSQGELGPSSPVSQNMIWTGTGAHTNGLEQLPPSHMDNAQENLNPFHGSSGASSSGIIGVQQNGSLFNFSRLDSFSYIPYGFDSNEAFQSNLPPIEELWQT